MKNITFFSKTLLAILVFVSVQSIYAQTCPTTITTYPYSQNFETGTTGWVQDTGDNLDWTRNSGTTTSTGTGPDTADGDTWYMYIESSEL